MPFSVELILVELAIINLSFLQETLITFFIDLGLDTSQRPSVKGSVYVVAL